MTSSNKRHILFLSSWYPNRIQPTLGNFVQKHAESVARTEKVSALHVVSDPALAQNYEVVQTRMNNVDTWNVYFKPSSNRLLHFLRYFHGHRLGWKLIREQNGRPDLVHHNILFPAGIFALYLKWFHGLKYIVTENWTGYLPQHASAYTGTFRKWITRRIANSATYLTPVSQDLRKAMQSHGFTTPAEVIYNVVETSIFTPGKENGGLFTFLHVSTLVDDHKNISGILRVVSRLKQENLPFRFVIAGDGDFRGWEKKAKELNVHDVTEFGGEMSTSEVAERMRKADCFVLFSNYENLPCVMIEAMSAGLPVVATTVGGMPEHIRDWNGLLVDARNEEQLYLALRTMILHKDQHSKERIRDYALHEFSYEAVGKKFNDLYSRILA